LSTDLHSFVEYLYDLEELITFLIKASNKISTFIEDKEAKQQLQNTDTLEQILSTTMKAGRWIKSFRDRINIRINLVMASV
jgi:hypothetical protein